MVTACPLFIVWAPTTSDPAAFSSSGVEESSGLAGGAQGVDSHRSSTSWPSCRGTGGAPVSVSFLSNKPWRPLRSETGSVRLCSSPPFLPVRGFICCCVEPFSLAPCDHLLVPSLLRGSATALPLIGSRAGSLDVLDPSWGLSAGTGGPSPCSASGVSSLSALESVSLNFARAA